MRLTKKQLKHIILEALEQVDWDNPSQSWGANDQENLEAMSAEEEFENAGIRGREMAKQKARRQPEEFAGSMMDLDDHNNLVSQIEKIVLSFEKMGYTQEDIMYAMAGILGESK